ncbi:family 10 glycosylhydrolase [Algoriphagus sp.]|uniref:glycoside hydrolase family 10 protein n=1 Tax=Algoriphagus sp. TaxID=1872435 RepID=UPI0025E09AB8|nr:family 10 glycosylhydrolase [Algoriphagus sp.]
MRFSSKYLLLSLLISIAFFGCKSQKNQTSSKQTELPKTQNPPNPNGDLPIKDIPKATIHLQPLSFNLPEIPREFRGVWIATVVNIDWPTQATDSFQKQKQDFLSLLDYYKSLNFNTVIVQVRTAGDAFYPSNLAPWSKYLTGKEGKAPATSENPLTWMIKEAHNRGLEFHAWLNPYRATFDLKTDLLSPEHDYNKHRDWMLKYGTKYYYNPGLPEVKSHLTSVIKELVDNYDLDAIHFDDYFYPYKIGNEIFPDKKSYDTYKKQGQSIDDWRRQNVNDLILSVHQQIKSSKPWVQFGISPFGVWRNQDKDPKGSPTRAGQTNYDDLYADPITWMKNGWIDYLIPQIYWSMDYELASYRKLNDWWSNNSFNTNIYIGNGPYKIRDNADKAWDNPSEILNQISYTRTAPNIQGNAFFSAKSFFSKNQDVAKNLRQELYQEPTLPPSFEPKTEAIIDAPVVLDITSDQSLTKISLEKPLDPAIRYALVHGANELNLLADSEIHPVWVGGVRARSLEVKSLNTKFLAIRWIDHYGRIVQTQVYQVP